MMGPEKDVISQAPISCIQPPILDMGGSQTKTLGTWASRTEIK